MQRQLKLHINTLSNEIGERNHSHYGALEQAYLYIFSTMQQTMADISTVEYTHEHHTFRIVIAEKAGTKKPEEVIVIGAHYDTAVGSPGADDNASGIAALLECLRMLDNYQNTRTLRFVAFPAEEPPFHNTPYMGSNVYAHHCQKNQDPLLFMISLEMLAYFTDKRGSQRYPNTVMEQKLSNRGNFLAIVGNVPSKNIVKHLAQAMNEPGLIPVEPLITYEYVPGTNLSDHAPFWELGYRAVMITDTAFYRNPNYHEPGDVASTLNFDAFARVVISLAWAIQHIDRLAVL